MSPEAPPLSSQTVNGRRQSNTPLSTGGGAPRFGGGIGAITGAATLPHAMTSPVVLGVDFNPPKNEKISDVSTS